MQRQAGCSPCLQGANGPMQESFLGSDSIVRATVDIQGKRGAQEQRQNAEEQTCRVWVKIRIQSRK